MTSPHPKPTSSLKQYRLSSADWPSGEQSGSPRVCLLWLWEPILCSFGPHSHPGKNGPWVHLTEEAEAQGGNLLTLPDCCWTGVWIWVQTQHYLPAACNCLLTKSVLGQDYVVLLIVQQHSVFIEHLPCTRTVDDTKGTEVSKTDPVLIFMGFTI